MKAVYRFNLRFRIRKRGIRTRDAYGGATLRRIYKLFFDIIEIYIPVASFSVMFITFIIEVFWRYILNDPLTWPFETTTIMFLWTVLFGAIYTMRKRQHIVFSLLYDVVPPRVQRIMRFTSNGIMFVGFGAAIYPSYQFISFMHTQSSPVFGVPFSIIYAPFLLFLVMIMYYSLRDIIDDIRDMIRLREGTHEDGTERGRSS